MSERPPPLFIVRHTVRDQLLQAAAALADDRISDAAALASAAALTASALVALDLLSESPHAGVASVA